MNRTLKRILWAACGLAASAWAVAGERERAPAAEPAPALPSNQPLQPFTTDGCSAFPSRAEWMSADWCHCCLTHDLAYWRGGTEDERVKADEALKACVLAASGSAELSDLMFAGVRMGGSPYFATTYRWGYGWPFGRFYKPLSAGEQEQASSLAAAYQATNPTLACPRETP